jgi:hypothetical protein
MWSFTSPRVKRISGPEEFGSPAKKHFSTPPAGSCHFPAASDQNLTLDTGVMHSLAPNWVFPKSLIGR